jgi:hypothetical protein
MTSKFFVTIQDDQNKEERRKLRERATIIQGSERLRARGRNNGDERLACQCALNRLPNVLALFATG